MEAVTGVIPSGAKSGSGSRASSPGTSPKSLVGSFSLEGIPTIWDDQAAIRERIRDSMNLCLAYDYRTGKATSDYVDATVENLKLNAPILMPLLAVMKGHDLQLPAIEKLISAVQEFFLLAKVSRSSDHCYQEAWALRRMIQKLKRFTYRTAPPQDLSGA